MAPPTFFITPGQQRQARACMVCSVVMTQDHFIKEGCPNCDDFLHLRGDREAVGECTSQVFEGVITLKEPTKSWVAKWLRLDGCVPGTYATKVSGILPDEIVDMMENEHKIRYIPRDGSEIQE